MGPDTMKQAAYGKLRAQHYDIGTEDAQIVDFYLELWRRLGRPAPYSSRCAAPA